jgi:hypothetical protein
MAGNILGMNKKQKQQLTNKEFIIRLEDAFSEWRRKKGKADNAANLIEYLVRHNFVPQCLINRFMCLNEYAAQLELTKNPRNKNRGNKQIAIWATEELVPLGETQIKSNIIHHSKFFESNSFRFP